MMLLNSGYGLGAIRYDDDDQRTTQGIVGGHLSTREQLGTGMRVCGAPPFVCPQRGGSTAPGWNNLRSYFVPRNAMQ